MFAHDKTFLTYNLIKMTEKVDTTFGVQVREVTTHMQKCGLINEDKIMEAGKNKGLIFKNYMGHDNIAYPDDLEELKQISKQ